MTKVQKAVITLVVAGAATVAVFEARQASGLRQQVEVVKGEQQEQDALSNRLHELQVEHDRATHALADLAAENAALKKNPADVLRLRGEVGRLRQENTDIAAKSPLSKVTANAESRKALRDAQKQAMEAMYKGFTQRLKLTSEQSGRLAELMADHVLANFEHLTIGLRDKAPPEQTDRVIDSQETILGQQMQELLGTDGLAQFAEYNYNLLANLSVEQFAPKLSGSDEARQEKSEALSRALREASQEALAAAGLPADYPTLPMYNFRNIASEQAGEQGLKLLDDILQRAAAHAGSFLSPEELAQFQEFRTTAVSDNRNALTLCRAMIAPISK